MLYVKSRIFILAVFVLCCHCWVFVIFFFFCEFVKFPVYCACLACLIQIVVALEARPKYCPVTQLYIVNNHR